MKVELKEVEKSFKPIQLVITIDSKKELEALFEMSLLNVTIPNQVQPKYRETVVSFLDNLRSNLINDYEQSN